MPISKSKRIVLFIAALLVTVGAAYVLGVTAANIVQKIKAERWREQKTREVLARMGSNLAVGRPLPDAEFEDLDGNSVRLGEVVGPRSMVCMFSLDCGACEIALDRIRKTAVDKGDQSHFVLISDDNPAEIARVRDSLGLAGCRFLHDRDAAYELKLGVYTFPFIVVVDSSLIIQEITPGAPDEDQLTDVIKFGR